MSMLSRVGGLASEGARIDTGTVHDHAGRPSRYLTDGRNLYRYLGAMTSGMGLLIGFEDCRSLEVMLLPLGELRVRRLRAVIPADYGSSCGAPTSCGAES
ncbi:MAG TPA: hypothetical protein VF781_02995 [Solirubrobacteraceae bacterium]